jgi:hypothetical protein
MHGKLLTIATALLAASTAGAGDVPAPFVEGEPFPTMALPKMADGSPASIADYRGTKLVLHVFASW